MNPFARSFFFLSLLALSFFREYGFCEQTMDSADALSSAEQTASDRLKTGHYQEALQAERSALKIAQDRWGLTHPSLVPILENLATLDRYLALYPEAESFLQWALALQIKNFGFENTSVAQTQFRLASLYFDWGHWEDADFFQNKAVAILQKSTEVSENPAFLQQALELLGKIELELSQKNEALSLLKKSLEIAQKNKTVPTDQALENLRLLAQAYQSLAMAGDAENTLKKALQFAQNNFNTNSPEVAGAMKELADFYKLENRMPEAKPLYESALKIDQGYVGSYFGYSSLSNVQRLATVQEALGQWKEAGNLCEKNLQAAKETFGASHPRVAVALLDLAQAQEGLGLKDAAHQNLEQALEMAKSFYRDDYPLVVQIQKQLGR